VQSCHSRKCGGVPRLLKGLVFRHLPSPPIVRQRRRNSRNPSGLTAIVFSGGGISIAAGHHRHSRGAVASCRFPVSIAAGHHRFPQTNPLARYDVLSSEKCRCSGRVGFPRTNRHDLGRVTRPHDNGRGPDCMIAVVWPPILQSKPMTRSPKRTRWQARENGSHKRAASPANRFDQTNPLTRYDVLGSEKCRCPGRVGFGGVPGS
jgi:hypothetical protein